MKTFPLLFITVLLLSQASSQEIQVPIDHEGKIEALDSELELKLHLFPEVSEFQQALLFQRSDSSYVLEIVYKKEGKTFKTRRGMSRSQTEQFRNKVTEAITQHAPAAGIDQKGRSKFIGAIMGLGLGFYGWGIPYMLKVEDQTAFAGMYMVLGAGSIFMSYSVTRTMEISEESANLFMYGSTLGIVHGAFLHTIFFDRNTTPRGYVASAMLGGAIEGIAGFALAKGLKLTPGTVELIGTTSAFGILYGLGISHIANLESRRSQSTALLLGSLGGTFGGALLSGIEPYTSGDASVFRTAALLGAYLPVVVLRTLDYEDTKDYVTSAMIGGAVGGIVGHFLIVNKDFTAAEGNFVSLATFGGGVLGLGIGTLTRKDYKVVLPLSGAGALIGFGMMYSSHAPSAKGRAAQSGLSVVFRPEGLFALASSATEFRHITSRIPLVQLTYRF